MKLDDADILRLLPEHISGDPQFEAAGRAANPAIFTISRAIPNLLIWARLGHANPANFLPPLRRLTESRPGLDELDIGTLESLAWQFHVDFREVAETKDQLAGMVLNSIPWHRIKGTPASMRAALELFGYPVERPGMAFAPQGSKPGLAPGEATPSGAQDARLRGIRIEEHDFTMPWACYQLGLPSIMDLADVARIVAICREMQPARCRLWRVYTGGGADNPDADPDDGFDMRPGVWSGPLPRCAWSHAWWSFYSGVKFPDIPGLDDGGLVISFGQKKRFQSEPYAPGDDFAAIWHTLARAYLIPRITHYVWSWSNWSDLYPPRHGFVIGELFSTHAAELICESQKWPGAPWLDESKVETWPWGPDLWPDKPWMIGDASQPWARLFRWDRYLPRWRMWAFDTLKSQGVYSDCSDKAGSAWSGLNCNWSWPCVFVPGKAPAWSAAKYSAASHLDGFYVVPEQFREIFTMRPAKLDPGFGQKSPHGASVANGMAWHIYFNDHPIWGLNDYSDEFPRRHGFIAADLLATMVGAPIYASGSWPGDQWQDAPWGEVESYDRERDPWGMNVDSFLRSQGVYSADDCWSNLTANWSSPVMRVPGRAPVWSRDKYSGGAHGDKFVSVARPKGETRTFCLARISPAISDADFYEDRAVHLYHDMFPVWGRTKYSGDTPAPCKTSMAARLGAMAGLPIYDKRPWADADWADAPWGEIERYGQDEKPWAMRVESFSRGEGCPDGVWPDQGWSYEGIIEEVD